MVIGTVKKQVRMHYVTEKTVTKKGKNKQHLNGRDVCHCNSFSKAHIFQIYY